MNPFSQFVNQTEMVSFSSFMRTIVSCIVLLASAGAGCFLLIVGGLKAVKTGEGNEALTIGLQVLITVLGGLVTASGIGAFNTNTVRKTSREHLEGEAKIEEAKERAKARTTEHPTVHADKVEKVEIAPERSRDDRSDPR